jgi:hypothetical protein
LVDGVRVIGHDGAQIYESRVIDGDINRPPRAQQTLDVLQDKPRSPKELVQFAMRWETLVQRLANGPAVPRDIASQTLTWRNEAVLRCERDPAAAQMPGADDGLRPGTACGPGLAPDAASHWPPRCGCGWSVCSTMA